MKLNQGGGRFWAQSNCLSFKRMKDYFNLKFFGKYLSFFADQSKVAKTRRTPCKWPSGHFVNLFLTKASSLACSFRNVKNSFQRASHIILTELSRTRRQSNFKKSFGKRFSKKKTFQTSQWKQEVRICNGRTELIWNRNSCAYCLIIFGQKCRFY